MTFKLATPDSYIAFGMYSLQTPLKGPTQQVCPAFRMPPRVLERWEVEKGSSLWTRDRDRLTIISSAQLAGAGGMRRVVQASGLVTMPPALGRRLAGPSDRSVPVGLVDYSGEAFAVIAGIPTIAERIGQAAASEACASDAAALSDFAGRITLAQHEGGRGNIAGKYAVLDTEPLSITPAIIMRTAFPEIAQAA